LRSYSSSSRTWGLGREKGSGGRLWRRSRRRRWLCEEEAPPRAWRKATTMPMRRKLTSAAGAAPDPRKGRRRSQGSGVRLCGKRRSSRRRSSAAAIGRVSRRDWMRGGSLGVVGSIWCRFGRVRCRFGMFHKVWSLRSFAGGEEARRSLEVEDDDPRVKSGKDCSVKSRSWRTNFLICQSGQENDKFALGKFCD
ncbi:hypothetical protein LINGRAHAP2_LOCUS23024, partial [Linum grandiflorum]